MVMGCDIIGKLRDINVSIIPGNYPDNLDKMANALALLCLHLAMKWFHLLLNRDDREV